MSQRRILVLTLSFGSGHVRAAQAVASALDRESPNAGIRIVDALENCRCLFQIFYVWPYWLMIRYAPRLWNKFFRARLERKDEQTAPVWAWRYGCSQVFSEIAAFQPDAIVGCEVGASEIAVIARRDNLTNAKIFNVITDFEAEPVWVKPEIAGFTVATQDVNAQLQSWEVPGGKIKVCGIPIDVSFSEQHDANETKLRFGLDSRPIILLMGGGMGPTRMDEVAERLSKTGNDLQIVALPGNDKKASSRLKALPNSSSVKLQILNWTDQVAALMQISSILVTKPGGLTLSEAAACRVPLVLFDPIPGPEESNAARFIAAGAAIMTRGSAETAAAVLGLLEVGVSLREMSANIAKLACPEAAREIANFVLEKIGAVANSEKNEPQVENKGIPGKMFTVSGLDIK